jgi:hypothetical protein
MIMSEPEARGPEENEHLFFISPTKHSDGRPTFYDRDISLTRKAPSPHAGNMSNVTRKAALASALDSLLIFQE